MTRDVFTLPHLPYLVHRLKTDCQTAVDDIRPNHTIPLIARFDTTTSSLASLIDGLASTSLTAISLHCLLPSSHQNTHTVWLISAFPKKLDKICC
jgi:hypothetical protein